MGPEHMGPHADPRAHLLLLLLLLLGGLLLVLRRRFGLVGVLFGTTFQELLGKVLGLGSVPQIGPDIVVHLVGRVHFFQEGCKRRNWRGEGWRTLVSFRLAPPMADGGTRLLRLTVQVVGRVEGVQGLLAPLHEGVVLAPVDPLEQLHQLLLLFHFLIDAPAHRLTSHVQNTGRQKRSH